MPLTSKWDFETAYLDSMGVEEAKEKLISGINQGARWTNYFGHSSFTVWTFSGLLNSSDISELTNQKPTTVIQWGCWNNYYVDPSYNSISHNFLINKDHGAAAVMGSSSLSFRNNQKAYMGYFSAELASLDDDLRIGDVIQNSKLKLSEEHPDYYGVLLGWTLLGDPSMPINK